MGFTDWSKRKEFIPNDSHKFSYSPFSSISNLSSSTSSNTGVIKKSLQISLPEEFGAQLSPDGRIQRLVSNGPAHASAVMQVGDFVHQINSSSRRHRNHSGLVTLNVTYSQIQVESRPRVPFMIEIGNKSHTALGMALTDDEPACACACAVGHCHREIKIASIQRGSLADRCGFLRSGDTITTVHLNRSPTDTETIPCSVYTSRQLALLLRQLTSAAPSVIFSIVPSTSDPISAGFRTQLDSEVNGSVEFKWEDEVFEALLNKDASAAEDQRSPSREGNLHSFCLWKDSSFDDWGFSILDPEEESEGQRSKGPTIVQEIRRGGPAYLGGLLPGDKIIQVNERDVSCYESKILVPILASLQDALNIIVSRT